MNRAIKASFSVMVLILVAGSLYSQSAIDKSLTVKGKAVKWEAVSVKNNDFSFYIPEDYLTTTDGNYYIGGPIDTGANVDKVLKFARYINGIVLIMEYYEGAAKKVQKALEEKEKLTPIKTEEINGFQVKFSSVNKDGQFFKTQHFQIKNRLYVLKSVSFAEENEIIKGFFMSVKLLNKNVSIAPNISTDIKAASLPVLKEQESQTADDSNPIMEKDADRKVIVLKISRPKFPISIMKNLGSGQLKLKFLYSSSGKVANVEVLESPSKELEEIVIESAKNTVFIPAEKDGKLVSVYKTEEYTFGTSTEIRILK